MRVRANELQLEITILAQEMVLSIEKTQFFVIFDKPFDQSLSLNDESWCIAKDVHPELKASDIVQRWIFQCL